SAFCTASIDIVRMVLTQSRSTSSKFVTPRHYRVRARGTTCGTVHAPLSNMPRRRFWRLHARFERDRAPPRARAALLREGGVGREARRQDQDRLQPADVEG